MGANQGRWEVRLSPHFTSNEFCCPCCGSLGDGIDPDLLALLERVRAHFGKPIKINSGYRCYAHNAEVGGANPVIDSDGNPLPQSGSHHLRGTAADIVVIGVSPAKVQQHLSEHIGGLGSANTFTHVDVRGYRARWKY